MLRSLKDNTFVMQTETEFRWTKEKNSWHDDSIIWKDIDLLRDHIRYHICTKHIMHNNADLDYAICRIKEQIIECNEMTYLYFRNRGDLLVKHENDQSGKWQPTHTTTTNIPLHKLVDNV